MDPTLTLIDAGPTGGEIFFRKSKHAERGRRVIQDQGPAIGQRLKVYPKSFQKSTWRNLS